MRRSKIYSEYWGLKKTPFENVSDPVFFYYSNAHKEALARMSYAVQQKKVGALVTGECGTGKTFVSRVLKELCPKNKYVFIYVVNPRLSPLEFIKEINYQLSGIVEHPAHYSKMDFLRSIQRGLEDCRAKGVHPVIIVDEAQSIEGDELLEEMRLLLNMQSESSVLFTLIILAQPAFEEKVERIPQLKQRLSVRYKLNPLSKDETREYIEYRLKVAGTVRRFFTDASYASIYSFSGGMPRLINNICDLALLSGFIKRAEIIDADVITQAAQDLGNGQKEEAH